MVAEATGSFLSDLVRSAHRTLVVNLDFERLASGGAVTGDEVTTPGTGTVKCAPLALRTRDDLRKSFGFENLRCPAVDVASADAVPMRLELVAGDLLEGPVLMKGEAGTFLDQCPAPWGCLAVEYSRSGAVSRAWPLRPEAIANANIVPETDFPYEVALDWSFPYGFSDFFLSLYPNGDLLAVFQLRDSHPYGGGVARIAPGGHPRWYRKDYSHHWPYVIDEDRALVPSMRLRQRRLSYRVGTGGSSGVLELHCRDRGMVIEDQVNVIDGRGRVLERIPILDPIIQSPYAGRLVGTEHCDPTHLNFAHILGADAGGVAGIAPGDLVVSLRNLSAFGILDKDDRRLKRLVFGGFLWQHGVRHLDKARFIMFDNLGTDGRHGPSRLLVVDLASGEESTVFPNDGTPEHLRDFFAAQAGQFDVSPDGRRVLLADWRASRAMEIRLLDGRVLNVFRQLHDVSGLGFPEEFAANAWLFELNGAHYANRWPR